MSIRSSLAGAALLALALGVAPTAQSPASRVVALGDVHGSLDGLPSVLRAASLVNGDGHWSGGTATFVQTGDVTDRGPGVRAVFDLVRRLGPEAEAAGGRVVPILGNHEVMNLLGELRDVTPEILGSFAGADGDKRRDGAWRTYSDLVERRARDRRGEQPLGLTRSKEAFLAAYPRGAVEYRLALGPDGDYGRWLRTLPIAVKIDRTLFMHAGAPPTTMEDVDALNARAKDELQRMDRFLAKLVAAGLGAPWFRLEDTLAVAAAEVRWANLAVQRAKATGSAPDLGDADVELIKDAAEILKVGEWSLLKGDGPLWYRGWATMEESAIDVPLDTLLARLGADRLVVGHTVNRDVRIHARLKGRLFLIDTGMLAAVYKGVPSSLELMNGGARAIYAGGRSEELVPARR
jgi:hypothetical protein